DPRRAYGMAATGTRCGQILASLQRTTPLESPLQNWGPGCVPMLCITNPLPEPNRNVKVAVYIGSCLVADRCAASKGRVNHPWLLGILTTQDQKFHEGLLHVQPVLGLVPYDALGAVDDFSCHFLTAVRRQAVHKQRLWFGPSHHVCIYLPVGERLA